MSVVTPNDIGPGRVPARWNRGALRSVPVFDRLAVGALGVLLLVAILGPLFNPHNPTLASGPPLQAPDGAFPFGTDDAGRDMLSRCLSGMQVDDALRS